MKKLGKKELVLDLYQPLDKIPDFLTAFNLKLSDDGLRIIYSYDAEKEDNGVFTLIDQLREHSIKCKDFNTQQSSLEEIFVKLVGEK